MAQTPALMYSGDSAIDYTPSRPSLAATSSSSGRFPMIATGDIAAGAKGSLAVEGVWKVPKATGAFTAGDAVYWHTGGSPSPGRQVFRRRSTARRPAAT
jgi:predicted RecA/RadA family phage recombinase